MTRLLQYALLLLIQFQPALPGYKYEFPRDHGSHPEFKIEWWYYTGHLRAEGGQEFGYELTFFRRGVEGVRENPSQWNIRDLYMTHFAVTDITQKKFHYFEKLNRAGPGLAGAAAGALNSWNANWSARAEGEVMKLTANSGAAAIELSLQPAKPPVIHGANGVSQKSEGVGRSSHYYSMTRLTTTGSLRLQDQTFSVTGESWMDHEFGSNQLAENQIGWDWFSMQLDNGADVMLYRLRNRDGSVDPYSSGTIVDTTAAHLRISDFTVTATRQWKSPVTGTVYPIEWAVSIPSRNAQLRLTPLVDAQELVTRSSTGIAYWEGAMAISGTWEGRPVTGKGYLELTGYSERDRPRV